MTKKPQAAFRFLGQPNVVWCELPEWLKQIVSDKIISQAPGWEDATPPIGDSELIEQLWLRYDWGPLGSVADHGMAGQSLIFELRFQDAEIEDLMNVRAREMAEDLGVCMQSSYDRETGQAWVVFCPCGLMDVHSALFAEV